MAKALRNALNGHTKPIIVGGVGFGTLLTVIGVLMKPTWERMLSAADQVPLVAARLEDHENLPIHPGASTMIQNLAEQVERLNVAQDNRFEDKQAADTERWSVQRATNLRLEEGQRSIDSKLDRVIEKLDKRP